MRILLAEDHTIVRQGLRTILEKESGWTVVAETGDGLEAVRLAEKHEPDVLVVDLTMPGLNGLEVIRQVRQRRPQTKIVVLSMHANEDFIVEALRHGASAYVLKESSAEDLVRAVRHVQAGRRFFSDALPREVIEAYEKADPEKIHDRYDLLTPREREILQLVAEGYSSPEVAEKLFISPRTVDTHRSNLMAKLGLKNQTELVQYALRRGLIPF